VATLRNLEKRWAGILSEARALDRFLKKDGIDGEVSKMRPFLGLLDFLESGREQIRALKGRLSFLESWMESDRRSMGAMVDSLVEDTKRISMTPFSTLFDILPRTVRDLLAFQGKEADLILSGGDVEVDRRILEELKDPLIHLIRNCVDYGVDKPEQRALHGKPPSGKISVSVAYRDSGKAEFTVADDGPGIDINKVKISAMKLGLLSPEDSEKLDEERLLAFAFRSGVSTSQTVTDLSGRGLGLAIVQEKVEKLGGMISCESSAETGTAFRILLPLTLATVRGVLVRLGERLFVIPTAHVRRTIRVSPGDILAVEGRETISFNGFTLPLVHQERLLELPSTRKNEEKSSLFHIVVLEAEEKFIALKTDEVLTEQEFLVKGLGRQLKRVRNVSGATVLGEGRVVPVLNVSDMIKSAVESPEALLSVIPPPREAEMKRSILVAEDSVTARTLLKNILEAAGYEVRTAVDGLDAYSLLRAEVFDLVVSDVDMPRMNGFELTTKIRSDKRIAELPVILVTALDSREDRERGIDVGANAYIVKSSFDQSNLLEVIKRLL
jgi:two-component system chemotaxis sensor kinase CheA